MNRFERVWSPWVQDIPPHSYALLRIALAVIGLVTLAGFTPLGEFWPLDGIAPLSTDGSGPRPWLLAHGYGTVAGYFLFAAIGLAMTAMLLGFQTSAAVIASWIGLVAQNYWNRLPLSSAHQVMMVLLFCLVWSDAGVVLSLDARRARKTLGDHAAATLVRVPAWPLLLMRCQIALIYFSSGLWKLSNMGWRHGTSVHWAMSLNVFHRFPWPIPPAAEPLLEFMTWSTLLFELSFPFLVLWRRTRLLALLAGIGLHLGLWLTMELGPFSFIMIASYIAFLEPETTARWLRLRPDVRTPSLPSENLV